MIEQVMDVKPRAAFGEERELGAQQRQTLMLHCGAQQVKRDVVMGSHTPDPVGAHYPMPHGHMLELIEDELSKRGLGVVGEGHALSENNMKYFGLIQIGRPDVSPSREAENGYAWCIGVRNAHDKSMRAGMVAGTRVFVCDNLAFAGEVEVMRKHTRWSVRDVNQRIPAAFDQLQSAFIKQDARIEAYKGTELDNRDAHDLIIRAIEAKAFGVSRIAPILEEWRRPSHEEFAKRRVWSWFNAVTAAAKQDPVFQRSVKTQRLHALCDQYVGLQ